MTSKMSDRPDVTFKFIEAIKAMIVKNCPASEDATRASIERWEQGSPKTCSLDHGVFSMCEQIKKDLN